MWTMGSFFYNTYPKMTSLYFATWANIFQGLATVITVIKQKIGYKQVLYCVNKRIVNVPKCLHSSLLSWERGKAQPYKMKAIFFVFLVLCGFTFAQRPDDWTPPPKGKNIKKSPSQGNFEVNSDDGWTPPEGGFSPPDGWTPPPNPNGGGGNGGDDWTPPPKGLKTQIKKGIF